MSWQPRSDAGSRDPSGIKGFFNRHFTEPLLVLCCRCAGFGDVDVDVDVDVVGHVVGGVVVRPDVALPGVAAVNTRVKVGHVKEVLTYRVRPNAVEVEVGAGSPDPGEGICLEREKAGAIDPVPMSDHGNTRLLAVVMNDTLLEWMAVP